jgi:hypothetical protein
MATARRNIFKAFTVAPVFMLNDLAHLGRRFTIFSGQDNRLGVRVSIRPTTIVGRD